MNFGEGKRAQTTGMVREFEGARKTQRALPDQILAMVATKHQEWRVDIKCKLHFGSLASAHCMDKFQFVLKRGI